MVLKIYPLDFTEIRMIAMMAVTPLITFNVSFSWYLMAPLE